MLVTADTGHSVLRKNREPPETISEIIENPGKWIRYRCFDLVNTFPRTDPYGRNYRIRLLPWMMTTKQLDGFDPVVSVVVRPAVRATWEPGAVASPVATA